MNYLSIIYSGISLVIILTSMSIIFAKQWSLKNTAVLFFFLMELLVTLWIISDLLQIITSKPSDGPYSIPYYFAISSTITIALAMVFSGLFINSLTYQEKIKQFMVYIICAFVGGVIALTLSTKAVYVTYDSNLEFSKLHANIGWIVCLAGGVLLSGSLFLVHLIRQHKLIGKEYRLGTRIMIAGVIIGFYFSIIFYAMRYFKFFGKSFLHAELIAASVGLILLTIGMVTGKKTALYGSSIVISINIYNKHGLNLYQGFLSSPHYINEHLVSGVATAIAAFGSEIVGEEVFPKEIDLGDYSLILVKKSNFSGFICCKYPTIQIHRGLRNIMENFDEKMNYEEVSKLVSKFLPYGLPKKIPIDLTYKIALQQKEMVAQKVNLEKEQTETLEQTESSLDTSTIDFN